MEHSKKQFTEKQVVETLQLWCDNVVLVGKIHSEGGDVISFANKILSDNYDYDTPSFWICSLNVQSCASAVGIYF